MPQDQFRLLFEHSSDAHLIMTGNRITDCNQAAVDLLKAKSKSDVLCRHPAFFSPEYQPDGILSAVKSAQMDSLTRQKGYHRFEWFHQKMDGEIFPVQVTLNAIEIAGEAALIAVWHDLTELKQKEFGLELATKKLKNEMAAAARIQRGLLPVSSPLIKGIRSSWIYKPCGELGGDMLNIFHLDDRHLGLYVLDVTGHGVAAALLSVSVSQFLSPYSEASFVRGSASGGKPLSYAGPAEVAHKLNQHFSSNPEQVQMFTLFYGILNVETYEFNYVGAGHPLPVVVPKEGPPRVLQSEGIPIGVMRDYHYDEVRLTLQPGDRLCLYSDGIVEAKNAGKELFGQERFMRILEETREKPVSQSLETALQAGESWCHPAEPGDDITFLACELHTGG